MLRQGPIPAAVHGLLDYLVGAFFIAAPFLFAFEDDAAVAVSIVAGVVVLALTASTAWATGLIKAVPPTAHAVLDLGLSGVLIAAPFLFAFTAEGTAVAFYLVAGVLLLLEVIATRWLPDRSPRRRAAQA